MTPVLPVLAVAAFAVSAWLTRRFCNPGSIVYMLDQPNERSLHVRPVPRGGGVAIVAAITVCAIVQAAFLFDQRLVVMMLGMLIVATVAFLDDRYSISPVYRLAAQFAATLLIVHGGFHLEKLEIPGLAWHWSYMTGVVFSVLFIVWMINLYNFMDGMDGFAGGMALFGFGSLAVLGWTANHGLFTSVSLIIACAAAGFLVFNFPPARIFMGDIGSSTLGLLAGALSLWGVRDGVFPFWTALLIFSPFIMDATVTLTRRALQGQKVWQAHKTHFYQKLVQAGWGHRKTVLAEYAVMAGCGITAISALHAPPATQLGVLLGWAFFYFLSFSWVSWYSQRRGAGSKPVKIERDGL